MKKREIWYCEVSFNGKAIARNAKVKSHKGSYLTTVIGSSHNEAVTIGTISGASIHKAKSAQAIAGIKYEITDIKFIKKLGNTTYEL